jgi:hypothetical protein
MGLLPTKGLTLPLMSYGGGSIMVMCAALAVLFRVHASEGHCRRDRQAQSAGLHGRTGDDPRRCAPAITSTRRWPWRTRSYGRLAHEVVWVGTRKGLEAGVVPAAGIRLSNGCRSPVFAAKVGWAFSRRLSCSFRRFASHSPSCGV